MTLTATDHRFRVKQAILAAALAVVFTPALADEVDALNLTISQGFFYQSNLYRLADGVVPAGGERADIISVTGLAAAFDRVYSRQRLQAELGLTRALYAEHPELNYTAPKIRLGMDWQVGNYWSGQLSHAYSETMTSFDETSGTDPVISRYSRTAASANYWWHPDWAIGVGAAQVSNGYRDGANPNAELESQDADLNLTYRPATGNRIVLTARNTDGHYPGRPAEPGSIRDYTQRDLRVSGDWRLTGALRLSGYAGNTSRRYDNAPNRDFNGYTGRLALTWAPTVKTAVTLSWRREIGAQEDLIANYAVTRVVSIAPVWHITDKVKLSGSYEVRNRDYGGDPELGFGGLVLPKDDRTKSYGLSLSYDYMRGLSLSAGFQQSSRSSVIASREYQSESFWLSGAFTF